MVGIGTPKHNTVLKVIKHPKKLLNGPNICLYFLNEKRDS